MIPTAPLALVLFASLSSGARLDELRATDEPSAQASAPQAPASGAPAHPNVLYLIFDDLNDWVGCLGGHPQANTPNIDRLAQRGVLFTNAHVPAPMCNPSRLAVLTGMAPHHSGLYEQDLKLREVFPDALTMPQRLRTHGYSAFGGGKVFHKPFPDPVSWDSFFPSKDLQVASDLVPTQGKLILGTLAGAPVEADGSQLGDGRVAAWAAEMLERPPQQPFFLACGIHRPHVPWFAPASSYAKFPLESVQLPAIEADKQEDAQPSRRVVSARPRTDPENARRAVQAYLACVSYADDLVGQVIAALDASPVAQNTIVVLWSDNGFHLGEKGCWSKYTLWEESTRVPLIVVAPGVKAGGRCARPVSLQDLYPTIFELCGLPLPEGIDGQSLVPLLKDPAAPWDRPALTTSGYGNHALRSERWRYIRYDDGREELYDHEADPNEWKNLAADPQWAQVKADLARWLPNDEVPSADDSKRARARSPAKRPGK